MKLESLITSLFLVLVAVDIFTTKTVNTQPVVAPKEEQIEQPMEQQDLERGSEDASEYEGSGELPVLIDIAYCNKTGLHAQYEELEKQIYLAYPRMRNLEITKLAYPIPESAQQMSQV